jgi:hypothetical protein
MKKLISTLITVFIASAYIYAQSPDMMSYQAVVRDNNDDLVANQVVGMQISILQGSASGTAVYEETHTPTANDNGLVSVVIGNGTVVSGDMTTIDWENGPYFIKSETDPTGGTNYTVTGSSELLSVPYALHAKSSGGALWTENGSDIYYENGSVSIGGMTSTHDLVVENTADSNLVRLIGPNPFGYGGLLRFQDAAADVFIENDSDFDLTLSASDDIKLMNGEVGVGVLNPNDKLEVDGDFSVTGAKNFKIDHPADPKNKFLYHAAIESDQPYNKYSGNITTDANGKAIVELPEYVQLVNKDFRYNLTVIGTFAQAIIGKEVKNNQFVIKTDEPNVKVSWELTGVRNDPYMQQNPYEAVREKEGESKGTYIDPVTYGVAEEKSEPVRDSSRKESDSEGEQEESSEDTDTKESN